MRVEEPLKDVGRYPVTIYRHSFVIKLVSHIGSSSSPRVSSSKDLFILGY